MARMPLCVLNAIQRWSFRSRRQTFHTFSFILIATILGLIKFVFLLFKIMKKMSDRTSFFNLWNLALFISLFGIGPNLFYSLMKSFIRTKCNDLSNISSYHSFFHLTKSLHFNFTSSIFSRFSFLIAIFPSLFPLKLNYSHWFFL